ncbi:MAG: hypothetical protein ACRD5L_08625, partial [Bryobacteraceae bacterium]
MTSQTRSRAVFLALLAFPLVGAAPLAAPQSETEPAHFFHTVIHLTNSEIAHIRRGRAVAKILPTGDASEIYVFGAVYIHGDPESYLQLAHDIGGLRKLPGYLAAGEFSNPPKLSDLTGFSFSPEDIKDLRECRPGHCDLQLPAENMEEFQRSVDWNAKDAAAQATALARQMTIAAIESYQQGGNSALGVYRDKRDPLRVADQFRALLSHAEFIPEYLPALDSYLLDYPNDRAPDCQDFFYWEKVNFGLKPTIRVNHAIIYKGPGKTQTVDAVAVKQLYASHYFETALDLSVCVRDSDHLDEDGYYLITVKGSRQAGLTGLKGSIIRRVAVDKTRGSLV